MSRPEAIDLETTYLAVQDGPAALPMQVGPGFWATIEERTELPAASRLLAVFCFETSWTSWEVHPAGDEVVVLLAGAVDLLLELPDGVHTVSLREAGASCVVPRGVWHTADLHAPSRVLHLTRGAGTEHRPR